MELTKNEKRLLETSGGYRASKKKNIASLIALCLGLIGALLTIIASFLDQPCSLKMVAFGLLMMGFFVLQYTYNCQMNDSLSLIQKLKNKLANRLPVTD
jgi:hypothetical protein